MLINTETSKGAVPVDGVVVTESIIRVAAFAFKANPNANTKNITPIALNLSICMLFIIFINFTLPLFIKTSYTLYNKRVEHASRLVPLDALLN